MGIEIEMEHTNDPKEAKVIALQHLSEDPNYYSKLNKIIVDPVKEKMELNKEILELETQIEAIDKSNNPIEKNPENPRNKGTTLKMDNVPEDKENKDKVEDEGDKFVKLKKELSESIGTFNETYKEKKVFISDPFNAPSGVNVQVGPKGGYFYDTDLLQGSGKQVKSDDSTAKKKDDKKDDKKDLSKSK